MEILPREVRNCFDPYILYAMFPGSTVQNGLNRIRLTRYMDEWDWQGLLCRLSMRSDSSLLVGEDITQRILHRVQLFGTSLFKRAVPCTCRDWLWIAPLFCTITKGASAVCRRAACIQKLTKNPPKVMAIMKHCRPLPALNQLVVGHQVTDA